MVKKGMLWKLGGSHGGTKSWKKRFFVLTDCFTYYESESAYTRGRKPKGSVNLTAFYVSQTNFGMDAKK